MVAKAKPQPSVVVLPVYSLSAELKAETREQSDRLRVAAFEARADIARLGVMPDHISPDEFAELRQKTAAVLGEVATCLDNTTALLDSLAEMEIYRVDKAALVPAGKVMASATAAAAKMRDILKGT